MWIICFRNLGRTCFFFVELGWQMVRTPREGFWADIILIWPKKYPHIPSALDMMYAHMHTNFTTKNLHLSMEVVAGDDLDKQLEDLLARPLNIHWGGGLDCLRVLWKSNWDIMAYLTCELFAAIQFFPLIFFFKSLHLSDMSKETVRYGIPRTRMTLVLIGKRPCFGGGWLQK